MSGPINETLIDFYFGLIVTITCKTFKKKFHWVYNRSDAPNNEMINTM